MRSMVIPRYHGWVRWDGINKDYVLAEVGNGAQAYVDSKTKDLLVKQPPPFCVSFGSPGTNYGTSYTIIHLREFVRMVNGLLRVSPNWPQPEPPKPKSTWMKRHNLTWHESLWGNRKT
jgi:hypothetical protein